MLAAIKQKFGKASVLMAFGQKIEAVEAIVPGVASSGAVPQSMPMHRGQLHLQKQA
jgi:hypothetical protein